MYRFIMSLLLVALSFAPSIAHAENAIEPSATGDRALDGRLAEPAPIETPSGEAADYAAREAVAPALGEFEGGGHAVYYVGGGALTVALLVVVILIIL